MSYENGTASACERTLACAASLVLPQAEHTDEYTAKGHDVHAFIRTVLAGGSEETALREVDGEHRAMCRGIQWRALVGDLMDLELESALAVDVRKRTARRLGSNIARDYEGAAKRLRKRLGAWEVPGSLDIAGRLRGSGRRVVRDIKTGYQDVTPARRNGQGRFFAAAFRLLEGGDAIDFQIAKIRPTGWVWYSRESQATFTPLDCDLFLDALEDALADVKEARRTYLVNGAIGPHEGPWCDHCRAAYACPAKIAIARSMLGTIVDLRGRLEAMTPEERGRAWEIAKYQIEPQLKLVLEPLREMIKAEPVPLSNGKIAKATTYEQERVDPGAALDLARALGASEEQIAACMHRFPVTTIRAVNPPRGGRAA